jgi:hypothetical protein
MLTDISAHQHTITAVTDSYTIFLSLPVLISLSSLLAVRSVTEGRGIWNCFTAVPNLTNLTVRTDRRLLAGIAGQTYLG